MKKIPAKCRKSGGIKTPEVSLFSREEDCFWRSEILKFENKCTFARKF